MLKYKPLIISLPISLSLALMPYTASANWFKRQLARSMGVPVVVVDTVIDEQIEITTGIPAEPAKRALKQVPKNVGNAIFASIDPTMAIGAVAKAREDHIKRGVQPIPANIRAAFQGFFSEEVLNATWRVGLGKDYLPPSMALKYGSKDAIVMVDVIIFKNSDHMNDLDFWAHELAHVEQYRDWGVHGFVTLYLRSHEEIEELADNRVEEFRAFQTAAIAAANRSIGIPTGANGRASLSERIAIR